MRLILVRHGETVANRLRLIQGQSDSALTENGIRQAHSVASRLESKRIDAIYSSDLGRARPIAEEVAESHRLRVHYTKALREKDMGELDGMPSSQKAPLIAISTRQGESMQGFVLRIKRFLDGLYVAHRNGVVLLVTHKQVIRVIMALLMDRPIIEERPPAYIKKITNASMHILDYSRPLVYTHEYRCD
jgi:probable phosphoglycerate mutase